MDSCRETDIIGRHWWEEFIIILKWTKKEEAEIAWEKIREKIEEELTKAIKNKRKITCSIWITTLRESDKKSTNKQLMKELVWKADKALYKAKNSWRNQVVSFEDDA